MEDGVDLRVWRQADLIRNWVDSSLDGKWAKVPESQFVVCPSRHGCLNIRLQLDKDSIPRPKGTTSTLFVSLDLHDMPCAVKVLFQYELHHLSFFEPFFQSRYLASRRRLNASVPRFVTVKSLERGHIQCRVIAGIVPEFSEREELAPMVWAGMNETSQKNFQALVDAFCLSVGLGMVRCTHVEFRANHEKQFLPKFAGKHRISI